MARIENPDEVVFSITLQSDDTIDPKLVAKTISDTNLLLSEVEREVRGINEAEVKWSWADDRPIELSAHVNGVSREDLGRIVERAERGFAAVPRDEWPEGFGKHAKRLTRQIVQRLQSVDLISVRSENVDAREVVIEPSRLPATLVADRKATRQTRFYSSVEGIVDVVSVRGRLKASITELNTNRVVKLHLTDDLFETVKNVLKARVVVEGMVSYREDGTAISVNDISVIRPRSVSRPLDQFIGMAPNITGGLDTMEYLDRLRGDDE